MARTDSYSIDLLMATEEDVEFEGLKNILHGEYQQSSGTISLGEEYSVTVTERDDMYHIQVRGEENEIVTESYVRSEDPYGDLPTSDEELYEMVKSDALDGF